MSAKSISSTRRIVFAVLDLMTAAGVGVLLKVVWTSSTLFLVLAALLVLVLVGSAVGLLFNRKWGRWLARVASFYQLALLVAFLLAVVLALPIFGGSTAAWGPARRWSSWLSAPC